MPSIPKQNSQSNEELHIHHQEEDKKLDDRDILPAMDEIKN